MPSGIDNISMEMLKKALDASSARNRVISHNIANINTKGYKAFRVVFEDKLKQAVSGESLPLKTTNSKHLNDGTSLENLNYEIKKDNTTSMRTDGNNVDIDNEMTNLAANAILYNSLVSQANSRFAMRRYVISEGRR
ncbi:Flagellar basal body rod protein FlgB [Caloramator mitchellensis]|uniref:Flagellar basal body rod protein FlgB n=1 Tax=Caloramator mitchellensis TaxID=908809 RepID=A0A0R3JU31_CALMK|nr:flagellar basal body rod protein FlgB [Caloramator mitchellensis]KRQ87063.1 Flagellar basal body rod protein FlgB [Caloramator mitchellensis]